MQHESSEADHGMRQAAIIVAAGRGVRTGGDISKQFRQLAGRSVVRWSVDALLEAGIDDLVVVAPPGQELACRTATGAAPRIVAGGATRTASVRAGLAAIGDAGVIFVHDAARPGLTPRVVRALAAAIEGGAAAAAPALSVVDALRELDGERRVLGDIARANLVRIQTPQAFRADILRQAYAALAPEASVSDDLEVVRAIGVQPALIAGDEALMKLTYPEDFAMLERVLGVRVTCVGSGFDAHRFGEGDHVMLCGVRIAHGRGLVGHSDADAGWHALVDAILGALGEGDIGAHFPPSDPTWKGADSETFLRHAAKLAAQANARIEHVDITLICEAPKIGPHRAAMRARTAEVLGLPIARVSVKATTTERMGFAGREEGLAAQATATLSLPA